MTISMYRVAIPPIIRSLNNLRAIFGKATAHAGAKKIDPSVLLTMRLYSDMFPLSRQVQIATDNAKGVAARLAGLDPPRYEDDESTFPELVVRIDKTIAYLETFKPEQIDGSEERAIALPLRGATLNLVGLTYLLEFVPPNFYFHVTTAYAILRHCGVEIGKQDFLGKFT